MIKKINKKAFTLIEVIVVIAIVGILALVAIPRFVGQTQKADLVRIQHDAKAMEKEIGAKLINKDDEFNKWESNSKDLNQLTQENKLFEKEGIAKEVEPTDGTYKVIPEEYKAKINTKLEGTFYANSGGKVYYEHTKPLVGIQIESEYSDEEIEDLIKEGYIPIATADELNNIRKNEPYLYGKGTEWEGKYTGGLDKKYVQVKNINLSEYSKESWNPIGNYDIDDKSLRAPFTGTYDGGNYVITGLDIKGDGKNYQGLFGYTSGATIDNVALEDINVTGKSRVGGLVGEASSSTISNSYATGSITGTWMVGGLVGNAWKSTIENSYAIGTVTGNADAGGLVGDSSNNTISNSYAKGSVSGAEKVGGLVGEDYCYALNAYCGTTISNSYATGDVTGSGDDAGGLVGDANRGTTISNSYATGSVTGNTDAGGLVGDAHDKTTISNSYATGSVTGTVEVGGLVGHTRESTIENSYATGSVTGSGSKIGGLLGTAYNITKISNSYAKGSVSGSEKVGGLVGYGYAYPGTTVSNSYATGPVKGSREVGGLMGYAYGTKTSNSYATGSVKGSERVGGLVGYAYSGATISNSYVTGSVEGANQVGGMVGYADSYSNIRNSYSTGLITGISEVGGLVGKAYYSTATKSYWDTATTKQTKSAGGGIGKSTDEMMKQITYTDWDFDTIWKIDEGNDYPKLR